MRCPGIERLALFLGVGRPVVDAGHARLMAGDVVQNGFDHMRKGAKVSHAGGDRPPDVVEPPRPDLRPACAMRLSSAAFALLQP